MDLLASPWQLPNHGCSQVLPWDQRAKKDRMMLKTRQRADTVRWPHAGQSNPCRERNVAFLKGEILRDWGLR